MTRFLFFISLLCITQPLLSQQKAFSTILTTADCNGPEGNYFTETHSASDGYFYFRQKFNYHDEMFQALILNPNESYVLTDEGSKGAALGKEVQLMLTSHDFQRMALNPGAFFGKMEFIQKEKFNDQKAKKYKAVDPIGNEANLFFSNSGKILGVVLLNPLNTKEEIEIRFETWQKIHDRECLKSVKIIQNKKDVFTFDYTAVLFDSPFFIKKQFSKDLLKGNRMQDSLALINSNDIQRQAHLRGNAALLVSQIADSLTTVQNGSVRKESNASIKARFEHYFPTVEYLKWEDKTPPRVHISRDGTLATVILDKLTETKHLDENGNWGQLIQTHFAWTACYRKVGEEWKIYSVTSTRKN